MDVLRNTVECKHPSCLVILRRSGVSEALRCLGLGLEVDGMLLVDKVVLLSVGHVVVRVVVILLDQLDDLLGVVDWIVVSLLVVRRARSGCVLRVIVQLQLVLRYVGVCRF